MKSISWMHIVFCFSAFVFVFIPSLGIAQDQEAGFVSLFNGENFDGWEKHDWGKGYLIKNKEIHAQAKCGNLYTKKSYEDYILRFEFKLDPGGNNGLGLRAPFEKDFGTHDVAYSNFELQVLDNTHPDYKKLHPYQFHGSAYGIVPAKRGFLKPVGEWNVQEVQFIGMKLKVTLNGTVILDTDLAEHKPDKNYAKGVYRAKGRICLAGHGPGVAYRNMRIKELSSHSIANTKDNTPPEGFVALFDGQSLKGWQGLMKKPFNNPHLRKGLDEKKRADLQAEADAVMNKSWSVKNQALEFNGKGRSLVTKKKYGNFEFFVTWKIKKGGDSGIYLRGTPQVQIWDTKHRRIWKYGADKGSGGMWNNKGPGKFPLVHADNPVEEWNTFFIRMIGDRVTVFNNGQCVVNNQPLGVFWDGAKALPKKEQIELQNHGNLLWFKNIYIRELPDF